MIRGVLMYDHGADGLQRPRAVPTSLPEASEGQARTSVEPCLITFRRVNAHRSGRTQPAQCFEQLRPSYPARRKLPMRQRPREGAPPSSGTVPACCLTPPPPGEARLKATKRRKQRQSLKSYPCSAWSLSGRRRGRPRRPSQAPLTASRARSNMRLSCTFTAETTTPRGTPRPSTMRCRLQPSLPRLVRSALVSRPPHDEATVSESRLARVRSGWPCV